MSGYGTEGREAELTLPGAFAEVLVDLREDLLGEGVDAGQEQLVVCVAAGGLDCGGDG